MLHRISTILVMTLLAGMALLAGCAGPGPKFSKPISPVDGKAVIYVYRASFALTNGELPGVQMNDSVIVSSLPHMNYFAIAVEPGSYTFTPKLFGIYGTTQGDISVEAGQTYFIMMRMEVGHIGFYPVKADDAMTYMKDCYLMNPGLAKDPRVLTSAATSGQAEPAAPEESAEGSEAPPTATPAATVAVSSPEPVAPTPVVTETRLFVETQPADARVRIMNIKPTFKQGIILPPGRYKIDVSAAGYNSYVEWIDLAKGEQRTMQVSLTSNQPAVVPQATKPAAPAKTVPSAAKTPASGVKKTTPKKSGNLSAEEKKCAQLLQSDSAIDLRTGAKSVYYHHLNNAYLTDLAAQALLNNYNDQPRDRDHIDAMAWLCKALGKTGNSNYRETLETVSKEAKNRKLRGYASKNLRYL